MLNHLRDKNEGISIGGEERGDTYDHGLSRSWDRKVRFKTETKTIFPSFHLGSLSRKFVWGEQSGNTYRWRRTTVYSIHQEGATEFFIALHLRKRMQKGALHDHHM